jgi:hypothetical protein
MDGPDELHIAIFPWLAFGHKIPYLELAKLIAQKGSQDLLYIYSKEQPTFTNYIYLQI